MQTGSQLCENLDDVETLETITENINNSAKGSLHYYELKQEMTKFKANRVKETRQIAMVSVFEPNKWGKS